MGKLIHLEDDGPLREIFRVAMEAYDPNIQCVQFISSDELLEFNAENQDIIDAYVLDIRVPGKLNGFEVAEHLRELNITKPIIVTSAYKRPDQEELMRLNITWMPKPWHILDAAQTIAPLIRK